MPKLCSTWIFSFVLITNLCAANSFDCFASPPKEDFPEEEAILLSAHTNLPLAEKIANYLGISLGSATVKKFKDGELQVLVEDNIRNKNVLILPSGYTPGQNPSDSLMELYLLVRSVKRDRAASITAIVPYYGYSGKENAIMRKVPISKTDIALFLEIAGIDRVVTMDLQCGRIQGFFRNVPVDNLYAASDFVPYFANKDLHNVVVVSPGIGGRERAKNFAEGLKKYGVPTDTALLHEQTGVSDPAESITLLGDVKEADVILVADMYDTTGDLVRAAKFLRDIGAERIFAVVAHPIFSESTLEKIGNSVIEEMVIADTTPLRGCVPPNVRCIRVPSLLGSVIEKTCVGESLAELFP